jgi:hypothetical protein
MGSPGGSSMNSQIHLPACHLPLTPDGNHLKVPGLALPHDSRKQNLQLLTRSEAVNMLVACIDKPPDIAIVELSV